jgi:hypothetical protein
MPKCEIRGEVGRPDLGEAKCNNEAEYAVSVNGLSPLKCCAIHANNMVQFWGVAHEVTYARL